MSRWLPAGLVLLAGLAANLGTLANGFAFDDFPVIEANLRLHAWRAPWVWWTESFWPATYGAANWRPWTAFAFNVQWMLGGGSPLPFHLVNLLLLLGCSWLLLRCAQRVMPTWAATLGAMLFAVHPVHVEAVGNGVGQAELWMTFATLAAVHHWLRRDPPARTDGIPWVMAAWLVIAASAKEQGFLLPVLLLLVEWTRGGTWSVTRWRALRPTMLWIGGLALALGVLRSLVLGGLGVPYVAAGLDDAGLGDRLAIAATMAVEAGRLLLWPAALSIEYGPPTFDAALGWTPQAWAGAMLLVALVVAMVVLHRRAPWVVAGLAWCVIAWLPASNLLAPTGILLAERTLLLPTAGLTLAIGAALGALRERAWMRVAYVGGGVLVALGIARSAARHAVWRSNETLFTQAVIDRPDMYRPHMLLAMDRLARHDTLGALQSYDAAIVRWPRDPRLLEEAAQLWRARGRCDRAIPLLEQALARDAGRAIAQDRLAACREAIR